MLDDIAQGMEPSLLPERRKGSQSRLLSTLQYFMSCQQMGGHESQALQASTAAILKRSYGPDDIVNAFLELYSVQTTRLDQQRIDDGFDKALHAMGVWGPKAGAAYRHRYNSAKQSHTIR